MGNNGKRLVVMVREGFGSGEGEGIGEKNKNKRLVNKLVNKFDTTTPMNDDRKPLRQR